MRRFLEKCCASFLCSWNMSTRFLSYEKIWVLVSYKPVSFKKNVYFNLMTYSSLIVYWNSLLTPFLNYEGSWKNLRFQNLTKSRMEHKEHKKELKTCFRVELTTFFQFSIHFRPFGRFYRIWPFRPIRPFQGQSDVVMLFPVIEYDLAHHQLCTGIQFQQSVFLMEALEKFDSSELAKSGMEH